MTDQLTRDSDHPRRSRRRRRKLRPAPLIALVVGVLLIGWLGWQFLVSGLVARFQYADQVNDLRASWAADAGAAQADGDATASPARPEPGQAYAILHVPTWGDAHAVPIIAGTSQGALARGVGAYASSVPPGRVGNVALAGYRTTHGAPFGKLLTLNEGDEVVIETREAVFVYVIDVPARDVTVPGDAAWVLDPVPGTADEPTRPTLTLTTSQDLIWSDDRSVAFAHLGSTRNK
ncbi:MAG: class E sortase [Propionibacteriaceae bacterium]|nr:class E sortase [Propionibacteriaceae bacterium]